MQALILPSATSHTSVIKSSSMVSSSRAIKLFTASRALARNRRFSDRGSPSSTWIFTAGAVMVERWQNRAQALSQTRFPIGEEHIDCDAFKNEMCG